MSDPSFSIVNEIVYAKADIIYDEDGDDFRNATLRFLDPDHNGRIEVSGTAERTIDPYGTIAVDTERDIVVSLLQEMDALGSDHTTKDDGIITLSEARDWVLSGINDYEKKDGSAKAAADADRKIPGGQDMANRIDMYHGELRHYARLLGWKG